MRRKTLSNLIKLLFVSAAGYWLSRTVDIAAVAQVLFKADLRYAALALVLGLFPVFISGFRWRTLLKTLDIHLSVLNLACVAQIGQFFAVLVPGVMGDDGARFFYISKLVPGRVRRACSTVLLDRSLGFASLFILTTICIPLNWDVLARQKPTLSVGLGFLTVGSFVLSTAALFLVLSKERLQAIFEFLKTRFSRSATVRDLMGIAYSFASNKKALCVVTASALATQILICSTFWAAGRSIGISLPLSSWMSFVPVIVVASVLPITFAGIGIRDSLLFLFLGAGSGAGVEKERIAALSLFLLILALHNAAIGGLVYLGYKPSPSPAIPLDNPANQH